MRFVLAIVAFVVAATMIVLGIAQRTVFLGPSTYAVETTVKGDLPYTVIGGDVLVSEVGQQTLTVSGSDSVFVSYGRTADVAAWLGDASYNRLSLDDETGKLVSSVVTPEEADDEDAAPEDAAPLTDEEKAAQAVLDDPRGSDLWLAENSEEAAVLTTINVPEDVSVLIASNGTEPAPSKVSVSWPLDNRTPWAGPLITAGIVLLLVGLALYLLGINHMRKSRGPRRKGISAGPGMEKMPKVPKPSRYKSDKRHGSAPKRSRSRSMIALVPIALVSSLALSGCSAGFWPDLAPDASPSATPTATELDAEQEDDQPAPAVTAPQLERITARISTTTLEADQALNADLAATRFVGPALDERKGNYAIRAKIPEYAASPVIPSAPGGLTLPQATDTWPRTVMSVVQDEANPTSAPTAMVLVQATPRSNYQVEYAMRLEPQAEIPEVAPATIGAAQLPPDSSFLLLPPNKLAAAYADVITNGENSEFASLFDAEGDTLRGVIASDREAKKAALPTTASIEFSVAAGEAPPVALATNESGALVSVNIAETEVVKPLEVGAKIKPSGAVAALSGLTETEKGVQSTYSDQLLFYVPPAGSSDQIRLLGFSQGLTAAAELA
ncbi:hypothetical protein [Mycetocola zhadangensis]|uniref:DUF8094 domain-containing protein n=1 Tax=Mycetocola zhadangensis TaxID=1164595 RepID=A0A3L7J698_9MICO|nr:hypothetical protein [Mycetocola zhadangensis]RLQ85885.1 hypothetical protein D9V28_03245 [Mycetocola zhadangensis]GGE86676.1 hypothetical protein GCM10011313_06380 [Mycetocola zhadangensis]